MSPQERAIQTLAIIRKDIWKIQESIQKTEKINDTHRELGKLSNDILEYIIEQLVLARSYTEMIKNLELLVKISDTPVFEDVLSEIQGGIDNINIKLQVIGKEVPLAHIYIRAKELLERE